MPSCALLAGRLRPRINKRDEANSTMQSDGDVAVCHSGEYPDPVIVYRPGG
jgi:hypothetical protein